MTSKSRRASRTAESAGHRHARLEHILFESIDVILRGDVADPRLEGVAVTRLTLSGDCRNATVWCAGVEDDATLNQVVPFVRARLASFLDLKRIPELRFVVDPFGREGSSSCPA